MAKKKKKGKALPLKTKFNPTKYIKEAARKLPIVECLRVSVEGLEKILIARSRLNGDIVFGMYLVDTFCLGLKNTFFNIITKEEYIDFKNHVFESDIPDDLSPNTAYNIIYGAIEYAEDLGFKPQKDFEITKYILDNVSTIEYEDIEFGDNGRPLFIEGPNDNATKILKQLEKVVGFGNFDYILDAGSLEDDDEYEYDDDDDDDDEFYDEDDDDEYDEYTEVKE